MPPSAADPTAHAEMEVIGVGGIVVGPQHGAEDPAGALPHFLQNVRKK